MTPIISIASGVRVMGVMGIMGVMGGDSAEGLPEGLRRAQ